jgi:hypothetical protein
MPTAEGRDLVIREVDAVDEHGLGIVSPGKSGITP